MLFHFLCTTAWQSANQKSRKYILVALSPNSCHYGLLFPSLLKHSTLFPWGKGAKSGRINNGKGEKAAITFWQGSHITISDVFF